MKNGTSKSVRHSNHLTGGEQADIRIRALDSTGAGFFIIDIQKSDFPINYANDAFLSMTGYSKEALQGLNYFTLFGSNAAEHVLERIKQTLRHGGVFRGEIQNLKRTGETFWSNLRLAPMRDSDGEITHYVGLQIDCTYCALMKLRDQKIEEQQEELLHMARVGELSELVSSFAHEINQPLTSMLAYAQAAQRLLGDRESEIKEILQYIINDDQRATEIIRNLRSLLKKNQPSFAAININDLVHETCEFMSTDLAMRTTVLYTELGSDLPAIRGNRVHLQQVLVNLINNGLDSMEGQNQRHELFIKTSKKAADAILLEVKDSGKGIPEENIKKLFTHFFTSKPDGLGMGLSISRSIIEAHGGRLDFKNNPDRGATFYFTLPVESESADESP